MICRIASHHVVARDGSDSPATITVEAGRITKVGEGIDLPPQPGFDDPLRLHGDRRH